MNKTELKVFLKGLANFYIVIMIVMFLPFPGAEYSPERIVRRFIVYTVVSFVIFSTVYLYNRIRKGPPVNSPDTAVAPDAKETKKDDLSVSRFITIQSMGACFLYFFCTIALFYPEKSLEETVIASARNTGYCIIVLLVAGIVYCIYQSRIRKKKSIQEK